MKFLPLFVAALLTLSSNAFGLILIYSGTEEERIVGTKGLNTERFFLIVDTNSAQICRVRYSKENKSFATGVIEAARYIRVSGPDTVQSVLSSFQDEPVSGGFSSRALYLRGKNSPLPVAANLTFNAAARLAGIERVVAESEGTGFASEATIVVEHHPALTKGANNNSDSLSEARDRVVNHLEARGYTSAF